MSDKRDELRLIDYRKTLGARNPIKHQPMEFEIRCGDMVLSQGGSPIKAWENCAKFLNTSHSLCMEQARVLAVEALEKLHRYTESGITKSPSRVKKEAIEAINKALTGE